MVSVEVFKWFRELFSHWIPLGIIALIIIGILFFISKHPNKQTTEQPRTYTPSKYLVPVSKYKSSSSSNQSTSDNLTPKTTPSKADAKIENKPVQEQYEGNVENMKAMYKWIISNPVCTENYSWGTEEQFIKGMAKPEWRKVAYDILKEVGALEDDVTVEDWDEYLGFKATNATAPSYIGTKLKTGQYPFGSNKYDQKSLSELMIDNQSEIDAVVVLENKAGKWIRNVFVGRKSSFTMTKIPPGVYIMKTMRGTSWNAYKNNGANRPKGGFMKNCCYSKSEWNDPFDFRTEETDDGISYPRYSVTLHTVVNGNFHTTPTTIDDFFE